MITPSRHKNSLANAKRAARALFHPFDGAARRMGLTAAERAEILGFQAGDCADLETEDGFVNAMRSRSWSRIVAIIEIDVLISSSQIDPGDLQGWVRKGNTSLSGKSPLQMLISPRRAIEVLRIRLEMETGKVWGDRHRSKPGRSQPTQTMALAFRDSTASQDDRLI